jgi:hypothetical protein
MSTSQRSGFEHVYWIGGPPDSAKSTVADLLGERYGVAVYHYDRTDAAHHERLAAANPSYLAFVNASLDERWVDAEPQELFERSLESFRDRWPMVLEDIGGLAGQPVLAEGFGLIPELVAQGAQPPRCAFLVPTPAFKAMSVVARDKPVWRHETRDPERARSNLLARDDLLAEYVRREAGTRGLPIIEVDTATDADAIAGKVATVFGL